MESDSSPSKSSTSLENSSTQSPIDPTPSTSKAGENQDQDMSPRGFPNGESLIDPVMFKTLVAMGMDRNLSRKALICTKSRSVDFALQWIGELGAEEMEALCDGNEMSSDCSSDWEDCEADGLEPDDLYYKMVFVVNTEHGMGVGKIASQVGHAALGLYRLLKEDWEKYQSSLDDWELTGERKVTLKGDSTLELLELQANAEKNELPTFIAEDAGKTQVAEGSVTVLGIFGDEEAVNDVTGHLKLL